jgi:hypothetical protein
MEIPIEKVFRRGENKKKIGCAQYVQIFFRMIMWACVGLSLLFLSAYIALCMVWLLLGAIVNPSAFLPYATASATFITVISAKSAEAVKLA